jgi:hypothetical protein
MAKRSNRMERRDNYEKALREEEEALLASMGKKPAALEGSETVEIAHTPIAPRWARAQREKDKKKKQH